MLNTEPFLYKSIITADRRAAGSFPCEWTRFLNTVANIYVYLFVWSWRSSSLIPSSFVDLLRGDVLMACVIPDAQRRSSIISRSWYERLVWLLSSRVWRSADENRISCSSPFAAKVCFQKATNRGNACRVWCGASILGEEPLCWEGTSFEMLDGAIERMNIVCP